MKEEAPITLSAPNAGSFYQVDPIEENRAYDLVFLGIPSVLGVLGNKSSKSGSAAIRQASRIFPDHKDEKGLSIGWYDYTSQEVLLEARNMGDAGDFLLKSLDPLSSLRQIPHLIRALLEQAKLLVILGGDHSLTYWTRQAIQGSCLVFIDAHEDATQKAGEYPHHGNVISYLEEDENCPIVQIGLRGIVPNRRNPVPANRHIAADGSGLASALSRYKEREIIVSIDADILDPSVISSVNSPMPGGWTVDRLLETIAEVSSLNDRVRILELMEFTPFFGDHPTESITLAKFLLRASHILLQVR